MKQAFDIVVITAIGYLLAVKLLLPSFPALGPAPPDSEDEIVITEEVTQEQFQKQVEFQKAAEETKQKEKDLEQQQKQLKEAEENAKAAIQKAQATTEEAEQVKKEARALVERAEKAVDKVTGGSPFKWFDDYDLALHQAREEGKPLLIDFSPDWCAPCQIFKKNVWQDRGVINRVNGRYVCVILGEGPTATHFGVGVKGNGFPAVYVVDPKTLDYYQIRVDGSTTAEQFLERLK